MAGSEKKELPRLEVYLKHSVLVSSIGTEEEFREGGPNSAAKKRLATIKDELGKGFLDKLIIECSRPDFSVSLISPEATSLLTKLVDSVTSEVGRALVGLMVIQLSVKAISPKQSIRLHKGGKQTNSFSWEDGIPMRIIDKSYVTPVLRKYGLLRLNADGVFMTRSLAENYPYSNLYKAALRGARTEWLDLIEMVEAGTLPPLDALKNLIAMLHNRSEKFKVLADAALKSAYAAAKRISSLASCISYFKRLVDNSTYSARLFEIAMHSFFQVLDDNKALDGYLKPLSQMRSANKKHGDVGDIEITEGKGTLQILESWDAKYGKAYLRDELEELNDKLRDHPEMKLAGFVVDTKPNLKKEIISRVKEMEEQHDVKILILEFGTWARAQYRRTDISEAAFSRQWVVAFAECLCQLRRDRAPIDEPSDAWVVGLRTFSDSWT